MRTSTAKSDDIYATALIFDAEMMRVRLNDGREIGAPLNWFPRLQNASAKQRNNWRWIGKGIGIHWPDLDEDISVQALLK
jgi:hypothetical protein